MNRIIAITLAALISGCAPAGTWIKPDFTQKVFATDRYDCLREARRPVSSAYVGPYGGSAQQTVAVDEGLYGACMGARGYSWRADR